MPNPDEEEKEMRILSGKLVDLASRINLNIYYPKQQFDVKQLRSYLRELSIMIKVLESKLESCHPVDEIDS